MQVQQSLSYHQQLMEVMRIEADAIQQAAAQLKSHETQKAIELLLTCEGKVIVLRVGKSGIVTHKIAATLASIRTTTVYMHAADAVHGDLGIIHKKDIVLTISNSGETE